MKTEPNRATVRVCISEYSLDMKSKSMIFADELFMKCAAHDRQTCNVNQFINNELC